MTVYDGVKESVADVENAQMVRAMYELKTEGARKRISEGKLKISDCSGYQLGALKGWIESLGGRLLVTAIFDDAPEDKKRYKVPVGIALV